MRKFFYTHFSDDVPRHIEDKYNKLRRKEMWIEEKEADFRAYSVDYDELVTVIADPSTLPVNEIAAEKEALFQSRLDYLPTAMEMLKAEFPEGYELIKDYFYSTNKVNVSRKQIWAYKEYGEVSSQACKGETERIHHLA